MRHCGAASRSEDRAPRCTGCTFPRGLRPACTAGARRKQPCQPVSLGRTLLSLLLPSSLARDLGPSRPQAGSAPPPEPAVTCKHGKRGLAGGPVLSHRKVSGGADVTLLSGTRSSSVSGPVQGQGMLFPFKGRGCEPHTMEGTVQTLDRDPRSSGGLLAVRGLRHCLPFLLLNPTCAIGCKRDRRITLRYLQE